MAKFRIGGSGPNGRGLGRIAGITKRRFDKSGETYETDDPNELQLLRWCPYVEEVVGRSTASGELRKSSKAGPAELRCMKMREVIRISNGLFRVGMTKTELIDKIMMGS